MLFVDFPKVRKLMLPAAIVMALGFGSNAVADNDQTEHVPADTHFYMGTGKPLPVNDVFSLLPALFDSETLTGVMQLDEETALKVQAFLADPAKFTEEWGFGSELEYSIYSVGVFPVLRVKGDREKFEAKVAELAASQEVEFDELTHKDSLVRIFSDSSEDTMMPDVEAPDAAEIALAEAAMASAQKNSTEAQSELSTATAALDEARSANDASGIADAANKIATAGQAVSDAESALSDARKQFADLQKRAEGTQGQNAHSGKTGPGLVLASHGEDLILTLSSDAYDPAMLDLLLGYEKPSRSLQASGKFKDIRKEWGYGDDLAMFIDSRLIADTLTGGNSLGAQQFKALAENNDDLRGIQQMLSSEPCRSEISQITNNWPMLVSGYRKFEIGGDVLELDSHVAVLLNHEPLRDTLKLLRGMMPMSQSGEDAMLSFGVGLGVDTLPQLSAQMTDILDGLNYQCQGISQLNVMGETDISSLSMGALMVSGVARGVRGISASIFDADFDFGSQRMPVRNADAVIALAVDDPTALIQALRAIPPLSILGELPLDGSPMLLNNVLPIPLPPGVEISAAVKGKNIVLYSGEQSQDFANRVSDNGQEGFMMTNISTAKIMSRVKEIMQGLPVEIKDGEDMSAVMQMLQAYPQGDLAYQIDFTDKGIELEGFTKMEKPEK